MCFARTFTRACTHTHASMRTRARAHTHTHTHTLTHTHTHSHTHTYTHTHPAGHEHLRYAHLIKFWIIKSSESESSVITPEKYYHNHNSVYHSWFDELNVVKIKQHENWIIEKLRQVLHSAWAQGMGHTEQNERDYADPWIFRVLCAQISVGYPYCFCHVPGFSAKGMCVSRNV